MSTVGKNVYFTGFKVLFLHLLEIGIFLQEFILISRKNYETFSVYAVELIIFLNNFLDRLYIVHPKSDNI